MRRRTAIVAAALLLFGGVWAWPIIAPSSPDENGFPIEDPSYLLGCYYNQGAEIRLEGEAASFGETRVPISFGNRKTLREVFYPESYPWFDPASGKFQFRNDRFGLVDLIEGENGEWEIEVYTSIYLASNDPSDLNTVNFRKGDCRDSAISSRTE